MGDRRVCSDKVKARMSRDVLTVVWLFGLGEVIGSKFGWGKGCYYRTFSQFSLVAPRKWTVAWVTTASLQIPSRPANIYTRLSTVDIKV